MPDKPWSKLWTPVEGAKAVSGGQGSVIRVFSSVTGTVGALKEILPENKENRERRQRIAREVLALAQISSHSVPEVLDHNMDSVEDLRIPLYLVTNWIDGQTLQQLAGGMPVSIEEALPECVKDFETPKLIN